MEISVVLESNNKGGFIAYIPSLPGCISEGDTKEETLSNFKDAIEGYLYIHQDEVPKNKSVVIEKISI